MDIVTERPATPTDPALMVMDANGEPVIRITQTGQIFWRDGEVDSDEKFRMAMMDLAVAMRSMSDPRFAAEYVALRNQNHSLGQTVLRLQEERTRLLERIEKLTDAQA